MGLEWKPAEGGGQRAASELANNAEYRLRQEGVMWRVDLVPPGDEPDEEIGGFSTEELAKAAAEEFETETHPEDDGCAIHTSSYHGVLLDGEEVSIHDLVVDDVFAEFQTEGMVRVNGVAKGLGGDLHLDLETLDASD